jgi:hypothetical protein
MNIDSYIRIFFGKSGIDPGKQIGAAKRRGGNTHSDRLPVLLPSDFHIYPIMDQHDSLCHFDPYFSGLRRIQFLLFSVKQIRTQLFFQI